MIISFNAVRCHLSTNKSVKSCNVNIVQFLDKGSRQKKNELKAYRSTEEIVYCFSSPFREHDSRRSDTRTNAFHPFFHNNHNPPTPTNTVLRRAPRSLGSALGVLTSVRYCTCCWCFTATSVGTGNCNEL